LIAEAVDRAFPSTKRCEFITLLGGAAAWPLAARAQQLSPDRPIVGVLAPQSQAASARNIEAFRKGLRDLGYVEGRNITLEIRYGDGVPERLPQLAAELVALKPAVIRAGSTAGLVAVTTPRRQFRWSGRPSKTPSRSGWSRASRGRAPMSPERGSPETMRWSASGSGCSRMSCRASRASLLC
jgi:hypothetical protein